MRSPATMSRKEKPAVGISLGKTLQNDLFVCGTALGVYLSTTVRRLPESQQFDKILLEEFQGVPCKYGIGAIGTKLVPGLKEREPLPIESFTGPLPIVGPPPGHDEAASDQHDAPPIGPDAPVGLSSSTGGVMVWVDISQDASYQASHSYPFG